MLPSDSTNLRNQGRNRAHAVGEDDRPDHRHEDAEDSFDVRAWNHVPIAGGMPSRAAYGLTSKNGQDAIKAQHPRSRAQVYEEASTSNTIGRILAAKYVLCFTLRSFDSQSSQAHCTQAIPRYLLLLQRGATKRPTKSDASEPHRGDSDDGKVKRRDVAAGEEVYEMKSRQGLTRGI